MPDLHKHSVGPAVTGSSVPDGWGLAAATGARIRRPVLSSAVREFKVLSGKTKTGLFGKEGSWRQTEWGSHSVLHVNGVTWQQQ